MEAGAGLAWTEPHYGRVSAPFAPGERYPEIVKLYGTAFRPGPANPAYDGVRRALAALGLDAERFATAEWNPLSELVPPGGRVVLKPNLIRHWNPEPGGTLESVITHGAILRAALDYALLAVGPEGSVEIAEAPQHDCDFEVVSRQLGLAQIDAHLRESLGRALPVIDLRREVVSYRDGVIVARRELPGDPRGYRVVDLGGRSWLASAERDPSRFRGADYDPGPTADHHRDGHHEYLLSETVLQADLVLNLPKLKTHKKTGVTLALKNLVGINGDKNWLPHHTAGPPSRGGDEFPDGRPSRRLRGAAAELARRLLAGGRGTGLIRLGRRLDAALGSPDPVRSGNWYGNDTTWRMCLDLNHCLYYSDARGPRLEAEAPVRRVLTLLDGVVAGEGNGPLAPRDRPLGAVIAATDPIACDLVAVRLMGFDERRLPKVWNALCATTARLGETRRAEDLVVGEWARGAQARRPVALDALPEQPPFEPHPGWKGHIERGVRD